MKTTFEKDGIKIKSILAHDKRCDSCFFGIKDEEHKDWWNCNKGMVDYFNVPDCVYPYPLGKSRIYIENKKP